MAYSHNTNDITPLMTANNAPSPCVVTPWNNYGSPYEEDGYEAYRAFDHSVSGNGFLTYNDISSITFDLGLDNDETAISYVVVFADVDQKTWTLQGSTNGTSWTTLSTHTLVDVVGGTVYSYDIASPAAYRYYKFNQTLSANGYLGILELELIKEEPLPSSYEMTINEGLNFADYTGYPIIKTVDDSLNLEEAYIITWVKTLFDTFFAYEEIKINWGLTVGSSLNIADTIQAILGIIVSDWLTLIDSQTNNWNGRDIITDTLNLYDLCQGAKHYADSLSDTMDMTDANLFSLTVTVLEYLGFADLASAMKSCAESLADGFVLADSTDRGFNFTITEALSAVDVLSVVTTFLGTITEALGLTDTLTGIKRAYPSISESLVLSESITSSGTLYNTITETLRMSVLVELAGEVYECYVLNTPKFMPSMYSGFDFNSYAVFENRAFGANATGIYELTGETDAGTNISTGVVMSETDFGMPNQKRFRRGYLGISGTSPVMVLETEDGSREAYAIDTNGKFVASHELKSKKWKLSVADFDELETIKLIPVILTK